ncbi:MAG: 50S ribosome-binding GTPase [Ancrocorticia sp.]
MTDGMNAAEVLARIARLEEAMTTSSEYIDPFIAERSRRELQLVKERLNAGLGLTVAALAGGTGSGKSSLFNALSGLGFSEVGDRRPTTHEPVACLWNAEAGTLLDMIGVPSKRRIDFESILTAGTSDLDSLVLLDLPDHDSVDLTHSAQVARILPRVDMLIWVLDPQKYADHLIHDSYLAAMRERRDHMIVVLNQIDLVPAAGVPLLIEDVKRLLEADGLAGVPVYATSAKDRATLTPIHDALREAVHHTEAALDTALAELETIRARVSSRLGSSEARLDGRELSDLNAHLVMATGIPAVAESLRQAGSSMGRVAIAKPEQPSNATVVASRDAWLAHVKTGLPDSWQNALDEEIPEPERLRRAVGTKVRALPIAEVPRAMMWGLVLGVVLAGLGIGLAVMGIPSAEIAARVVTALVGIAAGAGAFVVGRRRQQAAGIAAAHEFEQRAQDAISRVTDELLVQTARQVLDRHRRAREGLSV